MNKKLHLFFDLIVILIVASCSKTDASDYKTLDNENSKNGISTSTAPIQIDLTQVPFLKLSDYKFFIGDLKNQIPAYKVVPYQPASSLFSDYAHKKRFLWMPEGTKATYNGADNVLEFPIGAVLIKTFYYDNVAPTNSTKIIETRLLIRKNTGWKLYDYVWDATQTEAFLDTQGNGVFVPITWIENNVQKSTTYKIPSQTECATCHKLNPTHSVGGEIVVPIGPKPQNLTTDYNYGRFSMNQLQRLKIIGYIDSSLPNISSINGTVNWKDTSKSLQIRARSYIDINCAHCHRDGGHCDYVPQRFNFSNLNLYTFGVCLTPLFTVPNGPFVINGGNATRSEMIIRMSSTDDALKMPYIGRTLVDEDGVQLMKDWINSLPLNCH